MFEKLFALGSQRDDPQRGAGVTLVRPPVAGVKVDPRTAQKMAAVFRAINVTTTAVKQLPFKLYEAGTRKVAADHPVSRLLSVQANPEMPARKFRQLLTGHALGWGNGYAEIERDRLGRPIALWPISPDRVEPKRDQGTGALYYEVRQVTQNAIVKLAPADMFHLAGPSFDGIRGMSRIELARETISLGLAAENFSAAFYGNGAWLGGIIQAREGAKGLKEEGVKNLLATFNRKHRGSYRGRQVEYLDAGLEFVELAIPQKDAEFIATRTMVIDDVSRWFDVPPHKLFQLMRSIYNNIEAQEIAFVTDAVVPWAVVWEEEVAFKLLADDDTVYPRMSVNGLMRGDSQMRAAFYQTMFNIGVYSPNEIREFEDEDPYKGGEFHYMQLNLQAVEPAGRIAPAAPAGGAADPSADPSAAPAEPEDATEAARAQRDVIVDALTRLQRKERHAVERALAKTSEDFKLDEWAAEFYQTHARQLAEALLPGCAALLAVLKLPTAEAVVRAYASSYCLRRAAALALAAEDDEPEIKWTEPTQDARALIARITGGH